MDYINPIQHMANEEIVIVYAMVMHWEMYATWEDSDRKYANSFDRDFKERFLEVLKSDRTKAESLDLSDEGYKQLLMKYLQMSQSNIVRIDEEYKNLRYHTIPKRVNVPS